ncbi:MAG: hypothetical protein KAS54_07740, partial [Dehalococcoidia bacterium]|nr:hypothetical protein [Dehalococcoidia bacterium]
MKRRFISWLAVALLTVSAILGAGCKTPAQFEGMVFEDRDADGIRDTEERGIPNILVSNGIAVTVTDETGNYHLPMEGYFVFITTPSDYEPTTPWYRRTLEDDLDFGLTLSPEEATSEFVFVQITDIHLDTAEEHV